MFSPIVFTNKTKYNLLLLFRVLREWEEKLSKIAISVSKEGIHDEYAIPLTGRVKITVARRNFVFRTSYLTDRLAFNDYTLESSSKDFVMNSNLSRKHLKENKS